MKKILLIIIMISFFSNNLYAYEKLAYDFSFRSIDEGEINLANYKGKTIVVVNVASRCGFTNQYAGLQKLYEKYKDKNFTIIGIPSRDFYQEFRDESKVAEFCSTTYGVNFPMLKTSSVRGENAHPFYKSLSVASGMSPTWNFNKYLVSKNGIDVKFYSSGVRPDSPELLNAIEEDINS